MPLLPPALMSVSQQGKWYFISIKKRYTNMLKPMASFLAVKGSSASQCPGSAWSPRCSDPWTSQASLHPAAPHGDRAVLQCDQLLWCISFACKAAEISAASPVSCATGIFSPTTFSSTALWITPGTHWGGWSPFTLTGTNWSCMLFKKWKKNPRIILKDCQASGCQCQRNAWACKWRFLW